MKVKTIKTRQTRKTLGQVSRNFSRLFRLSWKMDRKMTLSYYTIITLGALVPLASNIILKLLIDELQKAQLIAVAIPTIIVVLLASRYLVSLVNEVVVNGLNSAYIDYLYRYKLQNEINLQYYSKVANLDIPHFEDPEVQNLIEKTRDTMAWRLPSFLKIFGHLFGDIIGYVFAFIILIPFGWWVPVLVTIVAAPRLYLRTKHASLQWSIYGGGAPKAKKLWYFGHILQDPTTVREMKISQSTSALLSRYKNIQNYLYRLNKKPLDKYLKVRNIPLLLEFSILLLIVLYFLPDVVGMTMTIGTYTLLIGMLDQVNSRAGGIALSLGEAYEHNLYVKNYFEVLDLPKIVKEPTKPYSFSKIEPPLIEFKNVSFNYPGSSRRALKKISFSVSPEESLAIVGHNGAGKTTIVKLLCRFYDVSSGEILINGKNIKELKLANWYQFLGTLFQEFVQYHFTVKDNIVLGNINKRGSNEAIVSAAKKSGAHEFIEKLPNKYDQVLGKRFEDGEELSTGQWQKLAIARAFYEHPPVLILDEPTSAIDAEAEYEIFNNLQKQYTKKTLILVSHRFSTVRNASKIIVIDSGKITEEGTHDDLMELNGKYAKMFNLQAEGYQ